MRLSIAAVEQALAEASQRIDAIDAQFLLLHVLGKSHAWLIAHRHDALTGGQLAAYRVLTARRAAGEPVAYLTGNRGFWTLDLAVNAATLIPRPETELLVQLALNRLPMHAPTQVVDLGTGCGAIALALASERPNAEVSAVDASLAALEVARGNAQRNGIANVVFVQGDWFEPLAGRQFDLIASNPPYLALDDPHLSQGDVRFEPALALTSGAQGLDAIGCIVQATPARLRPGGWVLLEHGYQQGQAVRGLLRAAGLVAVHTERDLEGRERVTLGQMAD